MCFILLRVYRIVDEGVEKNCEHKIVSSILLHEYHKSGKLQWHTKIQGFVIFIIKPILQLLLIEMSNNE
jgi:hypothetical protein